MNPLSVSVVIPYFNAIETIERCLISVAVQVPPPSEIILVDDGSFETPLPIANLVSNQFNIPIRVFFQENKGAPSARNRGVIEAMSKYVAFLDADDVWFPGKLKSQYEIMEREGWIISAHGYQFDASERISIGTNSPIGPISHCLIRKWRFILGNPFFTPTVMVLRNSFFGFDERFRRVDDYKAWVDHFQENRCGYINAIYAAGFKPPIGHSGLTGSIDLMHRGYIEVLRSLLKERRIGMTFYVLARMIEVIKLPLRRLKIKYISST